MSIDTLRRIIWRIEEHHPRGTHFSSKVLRRAICFEAGTDERTITRNTIRLKELGFMKQKCRHVFWITDEASNI